ncbi:hypothetical protein QF032_004950 [Streptomyces achromogenes]|uniref:LigA protein n=1 Tax=Streptomyces achromogenes TaxID=67255 RepID=A0ABU0Q5L0_STRAH|nr:hypothetical protein [Streptomyces achromogenes]MDQ0685958.1 hypothetical protein [Streptomyces achromogenes]MDQ0833106.1 hypothetical protein [Streptomyces achromogenes]
MPVDQHSDPFEERLSTALHEAGGAFDRPGGALAAAGQARGHRMRLRRRAAVAGGVAGLALVGVGGTLLVPRGGAPAPNPSSVAASGSTSAKPAVYSADDVFRTLKKLLPKGKLTKTEARGTDEELPPLALGVFDDGKGEGAVSVGLDRVRTDTPGKFDPVTAVMPCSDGGQSGFDSCRTDVLPDGSAVTVYQGYEYPDRREDTKAWGADLVTPAGQHVSVMEWNAAAEKGKPVTRPEPPLSTARLRTLAAASEWRRIVDAMPREQQKPSAAASASARPAEMAGWLILRKLSLLLPSSLKRVSYGSQETGYGYMVVDDGKGRSLVQVNVQPGMSDVADELFGDGSETLADGTRVAVRQGPGEKGGAGVVMWTVDTLRKDGLRIVVSAFNAAEQNKAATRAEPALTIAQLRTIALSPRWRSDHD